MCPITHFSFLALGTAVIASFVFGFLWYGPLFGKTWAQLMGKKPDECKGKPHTSALILTFLGTFFTTFALAYLMHHTQINCPYGVGTWVWLGFYVPVLFSTVAWERRPWSLFALNAVFYFLNLQLIAAVLTFVR